MDRRDFMKTVAVAAPVAALAEAAPAPAKAATEFGRKPDHQDRSPEAAAHVDNHHVFEHLPRHAARGLFPRRHHRPRRRRPIVRYHEKVAEAQQAAESVRDLLVSADPMQFAKIMSRVFQQVKGNWAGKAAVDIALMDWVGKKLGIPLYSYFGLDPADAPVTTFSIGIDTPEITRQKTREAAEYPVLKIKVGLATDEPTIEAVRSVTNKPLRVDANEGWKDKEEAVRKINWLEKQGVEFMEQPMPAEMIEETAWVRKRVHIPIIADESCQRASDIPKLREAFDGVNIKLDKSGGLLEAHRMIQIAKALGMKTMLGCMISSSVSCTAAAHLSPLVDYADLDGSLLIANDPYGGVKVEKGKLILPKGPGLGLTDG